MLKPKWHNWYLTIWWLLSYGSFLFLCITFMMWYLNAAKPTIDKVVLLGFCHQLFCLTLYIMTEAFEFIWNRVCK